MSRSSGEGDRRALERGRLARIGGLKFKSVRARRPRSKTSYNPRCPTGTNVPPGTNVPLVVGLTGGIGSGKSTVAKFLGERGVPVVDADAIVHRALRPGGRGYAPTLRLFGPSVRREDGTLDRAVLAQRIFENPKLRNKLEGILHPIVEQEFRRRIAAHRRGLLVLEVPLLFETGMDRLVDRTVLVWAPKNVCLARLAASGRLPRAQALRRMAAQMPLSEKRRRAHFLLNNSFTPGALRRGVSGLFGSPRRGSPRGSGALPLVYKTVTSS